MTSGKVAAPSDSLLPMRPVAPFPAELIAAVAAVEAIDLRKYVVESGDFSIFVMTPQMMGWRDARAQSALARFKSTPAGAALTIDKIDPVQGWRSWDSCVKARCAVVVINVVPDRTPFLFHRVGPTDIVEFRQGNVKSVQLLRDGAPVEPIESAYIPAVLNTANYESAKKTVFTQGILMFRPREFAPKPTGGMARYELVITDATRPRDRPTRFAIAPAIIQTIINDFAPYGLTK